MFKSFRIGAATALVLAGLSAGCAGSTHPVEAWGPSPGHVQNNYHGGMSYRSKCEDMSNGDQRRNCYQFENQDEDARFK